MRVELYNNNFNRQTVSSNNSLLNKSFSSNRFGTKDIFVKSQNISFKDRYYDYTDNSKKKPNDASIADAATVGRTNEVIRLLKKGINPESRDKNGYTALMRASIHGHFDIAKLMLENGAKAKQVGGDFNKSALMYAASFGHTDIVELLIKYNADINLQASDGHNAIYLASEMYKDTVKILLENGADPNLQTNYGATALMRAAARGNADILNMLFEYGADPNLRDYTGETALMRAAKWNSNPEILELLIKNGADLNLKDNLGKTALDHAIEENKKINISILKNYSDRNKNSLSLTTKLNSIVCQNPYDFDINKVNNLLNSPGAKEIANIRFAELENSTILHLLAGRKIDDEKQQTEQLKLISYLLKLGADINAKNEIGNTPLTIAAMRGDDVLVTFLLKNGADSNLENNYGCTPIFYAVKTGRKDIVELLASYKEQK